MWSADPSGKYVVPDDPVSRKRGRVRRITSKKMFVNLSLKDTNPKYITTWRLSNKILGLIFFLGL
jgi:hypothetical protein